MPRRKGSAYRRSEELESSIEEAAVSAEVNADMQPKMERVMFNALSKDSMRTLFMTELEVVERDKRAGMAFELADLNTRQPPKCATDFAQSWKR